MRVIFREVEGIFRSLGRFDPLRPSLVLSFLTVGAFWWLLASEGQQQAGPHEFPLGVFAQAKPEDFIGERACRSCHRPEVATFARSAHAPLMTDPHLPPDRRGCEGCHGPGSAHVQAIVEKREPIHILGYARLRPEEASRLCLRCHGATMKGSQWHRTAHARAGIGCIQCHQIHSPSDEQSTPRMEPLSLPFVSAKAPSSRLLKGEEHALCGACHAREAHEFHLNSRHPVIEGRLRCSDCHEVHPSKATVKRTRWNKEMCVQCHPDKVGPFAYEHEPVAGWMGDGCLECHRPHGSPNPRLLKLFSRGLCAQCHTEKGVQHYPSRNCWESGCHVAHHGSNNSPLFLGY